MKHSSLFLQRKSECGFQVSFGCLWGSACTRGTESTFITLTTHWQHLRQIDGNQSNYESEIGKTFLLPVFFVMICNTSTHLSMRPTSAVEGKGQGQKVKVAVSMNIWLHGGKHPQFLYVYFKTPLFLHEPIGFTDAGLTLGCRCTVWLALHPSPH